MIFGEAVPKVCIEEIPYELLQQPRDELIGAIFGLKIFQGVITKVDLRNRERMAIVWLTDTEARCRVLKQSLSFVPVIRGCPVHISAIRAMPTIGKSNNNSTVYLVGIPQNVNDAFIIDKVCQIEATSGNATSDNRCNCHRRNLISVFHRTSFPAKLHSQFSIAFGKVLCCEIGPQTRIGSLKFAHREYAEIALAAECMLFPSDKGATPYGIDNKKAMLFSEAVPKVYIEDIPLELFQQHRDILTGAIFDLEIFQGVITKVDLRIRERMAIVWLKDTTARCSVLGLCQSLAPILKGRPVLISAIRARPAIWEFDDEWYQSAQVPGSIGRNCQIYLQDHLAMNSDENSFPALRQRDAEKSHSLDQYAADDPVFLRNWEPEIWKQWKSKYASDLAKAVSVDSRTAVMKDDRAISRVNQQIHGIRVTVMLATLSAIRNGYYYASEPNPAERITIHPPRQSSESFTFAALPPASNNIYNHTSVSVIKEDCLLAALSMKKKGLRPVVLNMASATSPGGGYRKGDGAQEENIFRRSNYFLSLDDPINPRCPTYPMAEFGGIYTPDVTVFRDSEDSGYAFRQEPFTMDFIAVAAYRYVTRITLLNLLCRWRILTSILVMLPAENHGCKITAFPFKTLPRRAGRLKQFLQLHFIRVMTVYCYRRLDVGLSKTLRTRLHVSATNSIKQLIFFFPEWRCKRSSFRNPAAIFLAVAQQYSRKFRKIVFAITEDHNSITTTNPAGNYDIFSLYLDHTNLGPGIPTLPPVTVLPVTVPMVATCSFGGCCDKFDTTHTKEFYHPPSCPFDKGCKNTGIAYVYSILKFLITPPVYLN
ncbi:hypothetical protein BC936DRAFT_149280 [Jimgerdemannia flammicorona]|uniref:Microbial-type PARG catalytic domain-containing protein n=1 Tax=Jimgerdemannia flammicorona TaxID=994334 RepID=A0A433DKA7_9FUNG|nr:hypothetical protein BC936DRAFT_149280 [Jimgerdemannia flammicorona]